MTTIISNVDIDVDRILTNPITNSKYLVKLNFKKGVPIKSEVKGQDVTELGEFFKNLQSTYPTRYFLSQEDYDLYEAEVKKAKIAEQSLPVVQLGVSADDDEPKSEIFDPSQVTLTKEELSELSDIQLKQVALTIGVPFSSNILSETLLQKILDFAKNVSSEE